MDELADRVSVLEKQVQELFALIPCRGNHIDPPPNYSHSIVCRCGNGWITLSPHQITPQ